MISMFVKYCGIHLFVGLSTDEKPTSAPNASRFYEMDTKKQHCFDKTNSVWIEKVEPSPTPTGDDVMIVRFTPQYDEEQQRMVFIADKTPNEILSALNNNEFVLGIVADNHGDYTLLYLDTIAVNEDDEEASVVFIEQTKIGLADSETVELVGSTFVYDDNISGDASYSYTEKQYLVTRFATQE